ncbi:hypothetical protein C361_06392 [Cryptococcus neoformans Tu259-1]|uniref:Uncharacterized protein n=1 Tax=Cryptococcus neoformans Tu259-1 TaxID=1230072 RepID=A0A854Q7C2_CRYNE|nr:hypothetical protein C361_06392 [Cryptococcus neoformans var. grubii Tu259-1]
MELWFTNQTEEQTFRAACTVKIGNLMTALSKVCQASGETSQKERRQRVCEIRNSQ